MRIREREISDLERIEKIARSVHEIDRYPIHLPDGDFYRFLTQPASISAWVANVDGQVVGHVALNASTTRPVMDAVERLGHNRPAAYVARLLVDPGYRRTGIGRALLEHARLAAISLGYVPALDVVDIPSAAPAIALYQSKGWSEVDRVSFDLGELELTEIVFVGPWQSA